MNIVTSHIAFGRLTYRCSKTAALSIIESSQYDSKIYKVEYQPSGPNCPCVSLWSRPHTRTGVIYLHLLHMDNLVKQFSLESEIQGKGVEYGYTYTVAESEPASLSAFQAETSGFVFVCGQSHTIRAYTGNKDPGLSTRFGD